MPLLRRVAQVAVAQESVEGTAESLVAGDANLLVYNPTCNINVTNFQRAPARATLSKLKGIKGIRTGRISFKCEAKGSGSVTTAPSWDEALISCGFARSTVTRIPIGAVAGGPFQPGETITGGTSSATGRVVGEITNGDSYIFYVVLTGVFVSGEVITGGTSGATATSSAVPSASKGYEYLPDSTSVPSATVALYVDGARHLLSGCRGNVKVSAAAGEVQMFEFEFEGVYNSTTDTATLSGVTYETADPVAFLGVGLSIQSLSAVFNSLNLDIKNTLTQRTNANATAGVVSVMITDRDPSGTIDAEFPTVASHDVYGKLVSGAVGRLAWKLAGSGTGNTLWFGAPTVQYQTVGDDDRGGLKLSTIGFSLNDRGVNAIDDEFQIGMV